MWLQGCGLVRMEAHFAFITIFLQQIRGAACFIVSYVSYAILRTQRASHANLFAVAILMRPISLILLLCTAIPAALADEASKTAKVEEFFRLSHTEDALSETMTLMMNQMKSGAFQQSTGTKRSAEFQELMEDLQARTGKLIASAFAWDKVKPEYVKLYGDTFTEEQLDDILAFYRSPSGQAMVAKNSALMTKSVEMAQK